MKRYPGQAEDEVAVLGTLADDAQSLLAGALQCARVTRFEVTEPTLEEIFIEKVRETSPVKEILEPEPELLEEPVESCLDA